MKGSNHSFVQRFVIVISLFSFAVLVGITTIQTIILPHFQVSIGNPAALAYPFGWSDDVFISQVGRGVLGQNPDGRTDFLHSAKDSQGNIYFVGNPELTSLPSDEIFLVKIRPNGEIVFGPTIEVPADGLTSERPRIAIDSNDRLHVVWGDERDQRRVYYMQFDTGGNVIRQAAPATNITGSRQPDIAVDANNNLHISFHTGTVYYRKVNSNGNRLFEFPLSSGGDAFDSAIAVDSSGNAYVAWLMYDASYHSEIHYAKINANGTIVIPDRLLARNAASVSLATFGNNVYFAWGTSYPTTVHYAMLNGVGYILVPEEDISSNGGGGNSFSPIVKTDSLGNAHVMWDASSAFSDNFREIYYATLDQNGILRSPLTRLTNNTTRSLAPALTIDGSDRLYLGWYEYNDQLSPTESSLYFKFVPPRELSCRFKNENLLLVNVGSQAVNIGTPNATSPNIVIDQNGLSHVVWVEPDGIHYKIYNDTIPDPATPALNGLIVSDSSSNLNARNPQVVIRSPQQSQNVYIAWTAQGNTGDQIFLTHLTNGTRDLNPVPIGAGARSFNPRIASDGGNLGVVWQSLSEPRGGNSTIWFQKVGRTGGLLTPAIQVSTAVTGASNPDIYYDSFNSFFVIVWQQDFGGGNSEIYGAAIDNNIATPGSVVFGPTSLVGFSGHPHNPSFAPTVPLRVDGCGQLMRLVWSENIGTNPGIHSGLVSSCNGFLSLYRTHWVSGTTAASDYAHGAFNLLTNSGGYTENFYYWSENVNDHFEDRYSKTVNDILVFGPARVAVGDTLPQAGANAVALKNGKPQFIWQGSSGVRLASDPFTAGDSNTHEITVTVGTPLELVMGIPDYERASRNFALYAWAGVPTSATVTTLPRGVGTMCMSPPATGGHPLKIWNNTGDTRLGTATYPSSPAPSTIIDAASIPNRPGDYTLQGIGIIQDRSAPRGYSVTNAIILHVQ